MDFWAMARAGCAALLISGSTQALAMEPDDPAYRSGIALLNRGMHDLAAQELEKFLQTSPSGPRATAARYGLAVCYAKLGRLPEAAAPLDEVLKDNSFDLMPDAVLLRAQCAAGAGEWAKAAGLLDGMSQKYGEFPQLDRAAALEGECLWRAGKPEQAERVLAGALKRWPSSGSAPAMQLSLAGVEEALSKHEAALDRAARLARGEQDALIRTQAAIIAGRCAQRLDQRPVALEMYTIARADEDATTRASATLGLAQLARVGGDANAALQRLDELDTMKPEGAIAQSARLERAAALLEAGKFEAALTASHAAGEGADATQRLEAGIIEARALTELGRWDDSATRLEALLDQFGAERAPELQSRIGDAMRLRASALAKAGKSEAAAAAWKEYRQKYAKGESGDAGGEALAGEAIAEHAAGRWERCVAVGREYLSKHADGAAAADVTLAVAESAYALQKWEDAAGAYGALADKWATHPQSWRARVRRGLSLWELGKNEEATRALALAVSDADGRDAGLTRAACVVLGQSSFAGGDYPAAERWFERAIAADGQGDRDLHLRHGLAMARQEKWEPALGAFQTALRTGDGTSGSADATSVHAMFECGQALMELARYDEAKPMFERVLADEPGLNSGSEKKSKFAGASRRHLATIASKAGRGEEAIELLALASESGGDGAGAAMLSRADLLLAAGRFQEARDAYERFLHERPKDAKASSARAGRAIAMGRLDASDAALKAVQASLDDANEAGAEVAPELATALRYEHAWLLAKLGKKDGAREAYRSLVDSNAPSAIRRQASAEWAQLELDADDAKATLAALEDGPKRSALWSDAGPREGHDAEVHRQAAYLRGASLLKLDRSGEAAEALKGLCEPGSTSKPDERALSAGLLRGDALLRTGRAPEAVEQLAWVEAGGPAEAIANPTLLRLGEAAAAAQQWAASEAAYTRFLDRFASSDQAFRARFGLGWARENQGRHEPAIEAYRGVTSSHQGATAARAQFQIGECLYAMKRLDEAVKELVKVDAIYGVDEWSAAALYEAGRCLEEMGRRDDARASWKEVVDRFASSAWARQSKERLDATATAALPGR